MSTLKVDNIQNRVGTGAPTLTYGATIPSGQDLSVGGDLTVTGNSVITGNLTVSGTTTTVNTTNTTVQDTLLELNSGASSNSNDLGLILERGSTGDNAAFIWDESADKFALGTTTSDGSATGNLTLTTATLVANLEGSQSGGSVSATTITGSSDLAINTDTLFVDVSEDVVGIGRSIPGGPANFGTGGNEPINCQLDVSYGGGGAASGVPRITMMIGADENAKTRTNNTVKEFRIASPHYDNSEEPVLFAMATNNATSNVLSLGSGTGSANTPTQINLKVNSSTTVISSSNDPQFTLKGLTAHSGGATNFGRLELRNAGFSESCQGSYSTQGSGTMTFDCARSTTFAREATGNVTQISLQNLDLSNDRVQTVTIFYFVASGSDRTVAYSNGVNLNGGGAQNLRFSGGGDATLKAGKINMLTIVVHQDGAGTKRVFATLVDDL